MEKKAAQRLGVLGPTLNKRSALSVRNGVLFYKQLIRPMIDYAYPIWRYAARSHVLKLQALKYKYLGIATSSPRYAGEKQIHKDLGIPFLADYMRALTESFNSKLADAENSLVRQLKRHMYRTRTD
jgi:hypothetical protein